MFGHNVSENCHACISKATKDVAAVDSGFSGKSGYGVSTSYAMVYHTLMWGNIAVSEDTLWSIPWKHFALKIVLSS